MHKGGRESISVSRSEQEIEQHIQIEECRRQEELEKTRKEQARLSQELVDAKVAIALLFQC